MKSVYAPDSMRLWTIESVIARLWNRLMNSRGAEEVPDCLGEGIDLSAHFNRLLYALEIGDYRAWICFELMLV